MYEGRNTECTREGTLPDSVLLTPIENLRRSSGAIGTRLADLRSGAFSIQSPVRISQTPIRWRSAAKCIPLRPRTHSSRSRITGSSDRVRCAGIQVAASPSDAIARTTPASTRGSRGVA
jgi:hypothetical protein